MKLTKGLGRGVLSCVLALSGPISCGGPQSGNGVASRQAPTLPARPPSGISELPALEVDFLKELNVIRANPKSYMERMQVFLPMFEGNILKISNRVRFRTQEGAPAVEEAIEAVRTQEPRGPIVHSELLRKAAIDHLADQIKNGGIGHTGNDGSSPRQRMERYADMNVFGEIINYNTYGGKETGEAAMIAFIVDDGVPDRGHRTGVFTAKFTHAGIACGEHPKYGPSCVIDFGDEPVEKAAKPAQP